MDSTSVTHKAHLSPLTNILHTECGQCGQMTDYCVIIPLHHEITIYLQQVPQRLPQNALSDVILTRRVIESSSFLALTFGSGEENLGDSQLCMEVVPLICLLQVLYIYDSI